MLPCYDRWHTFWKLSLQLCPTYMLYKKRHVQVQMFVYTETTCLWFHTADWKTCSSLPSFIKKNLVWRGAGNIFSYSKMRNLGMKADRKKRNRKQGHFLKNIHNSCKLSFSLKKLFVNLWHDQVCSHHRVAIHGSTYTVFSFYFYLLSQYISKSGATYMWEFSMKWIFILYTFVGRVCSAVKSRFAKRPEKV